MYKLGSCTIPFSYLWGILGLFILFPQEAHSYQGHLIFEQISIDEGLASSSVYSIVQDQKGYLWVGTVSGLNRYDGKDFKLYRNVIDDSTTVSGDWSVVLYVDRKGELWVGDWDKGLSRYNAYEDNFIQYKHDAQNEKTISSNSITAIIEDRAGNLWVGTSNGLNKFNAEENTFSRHYYSKSDSEYNIRAIAADSSESVLWIGTMKNGMVKFNYETATTEHFKPDQNGAGSPNVNHINSLLIDKAGKLWAAAGGSTLHTFNKKTNKFTRIDAPELQADNSNQEIQLFEDSKKSFWIATRNSGLIKYNRGDNKFTRYLHDRLDSSTLSSNLVHSMYEDKSGLLWIGTIRGGLNKLNPGKAAFSTIGYRDNVQISEAGDILAVVEDKNKNLWIGGNTGLRIFDSGHNDIFQKFPGLHQWGFYNDYAVTSLLSEEDGHIWIGTRRNGLFSYDPKSQKVKQYLNDTPKSVATIIEDSDGTVWVGRWQAGLSKFDKKNDSFIHYVHDPEDDKSLSYNSIYSIFEDSEKNLWIGTLGGGLERFDRKEEVFYHHKYDAEKKGSISSNSIFEIAEDNNGGLWIGVWSGGLNKFDKKTGVFTEFTAGGFLANDEVYDILKDDSGYFWLATNKRVAKIDPSTGNITNFDAPYWLDRNEFFRQSGFINESGVIYIGGTQGVTRFRPADIKTNEQIPDVRITSILLNTTPLHDLVKYTSDSKKVFELPWNDYHITIEMAVLDYKIPKKNQFAYFMENLEEEWKYSGDRNFAVYLDMPPGTYTFRTKGANHAGMWNEAGETFTFTIHPAFWMTTWFRAGTILLILGGAITAYRMRTSNLRTQQKNLEESVRQRTKDLEESKRQLLIVQEELEGRVLERTKELKNKNAALNKEIVEKKQTEIALQKSEEKYRSLVDNVDIGIYRVTADSERFFLEANSVVVKMFGFDSKEELLQQRIRDLYSNEEEYEKFFTEVRDAGIKRNMEFSFRRKDGSIFLGSDTVVAVHDSLGRLLYFDGILEDVTQKKRIEEELFNARKIESLGVFAGGIAHDFNNILTSIIINISSALFQVDQNTKVYSILQQAEKSALTASNLTNQLLTFSKGGVPVIKTVHVSELIKDTASFVLRGANVRCEFDLPDNLLPVKIDEGQISQVLNNIVINANQAMPGGGFISVKAENLEISKENEYGKYALPAGHYVRIAISDQGIGIPKEHLDKIFDPYFTTKQEGNGLGLTTSFSIIKKHKGLLTVKSVLGVGTTFYIILPAVNEKMAAPEDEANYVNLNGGGKILLMDDDESIRSSLSSTLTGLGYTIEVTLDGQEALATYKQAYKNGDPFDIVIMDLTIPGGMGGKETIKKLLSFDAEATAVVSSGYSEDAVMADYKKYGFKAVLAKPFKLDALTALLHQLINKN